MARLLLAVLPLLALAPTAYAALLEGVVVGSMKANLCDGGPLVPTTLSTKLHTTCPHVEGKVQASGFGLRCEQREAYDDRPGTMALYHLNDGGSVGDSGPLGNNDGGVPASCVDGPDGGGSCDCALSDDNPSSGGLRDTGYHRGYLATCANGDTDLNSAIQVSPNSIFLNDRSFTIEMWTRGPDVAINPGGGIGPTYFKHCPDAGDGDNNTTGDNNKCLWIFGGDGGDDGKFAVDFGDGQGRVKTNDNCPNDTGTGKNLDDGSWHHIAFVYDASSKSRTLYIDGKQCGSDTANDHYKGTTADIFMNRDGAGGSFGRRDHDEVRVLNLALTATDVLARVLGSNETRTEGGSTRDPAIVNCNDGDVNPDAEEPSVDPPNFQLTGANSWSITTVDTHENLKTDKFTWTVDIMDMTPPPTPVIHENATDNDTIEWRWDPLFLGGTYFCDTTIRTKQNAASQTEYDRIRNGTTDGTTTSRTYTVNSLGPNEQHCLKLTSRYLDGCAPGLVGPSEETAEACEWTHCNVPGQPSAATMVDNTTARVTIPPNSNPTAAAVGPPAKGNTRFGVDISEAACTGFSAQGGFTTLNGSNQRDVGGLPKSRRLTFRAKAMNQNGIITTESTCSNSVAVITQPKTPTGFVGNSNGDLDSDVTAPYNCPKTEVLWTWNPVEAGSAGTPYDTQTAYRITMRNAGGGVVVAHDMASPGNMSQPTEWTETGLSPGSVYSRQIRARDTGATSLVEFSNFTSTATGATSPLKIPTINPVEGTSHSPTSVRWDWTRPTGLCPPFQYFLIDAFTGLAVPGSPLGDGVGGGTLASDKPSPSFIETSDSTGLLTPNKIVSVRVRTTDEFGVTADSELSPVSTIYTQANPPSGLAAAAVTTTTVQLSWSGAGNPNYTRFELGASAVDFLVAVSSPVTIPDNFTGTTKVISGLQPATTYYFQVRAFNGRAEDGFGSHFTAPSQRALQTLTLTPQLQATPDNGSVEWNWSFIPGSSGYRLEQDGGAQLHSENTYSGIFPQVGLGVNVPVGARVKSVNGQGLGEFSGAVYAFTNANAPGSPAPSITAVTTQTITYSFGANGNPGYTYYELNVATDAAFAVVLTTRSFTGTTYTVDGLFPGTTYYSRLRAMSGSQVPAPNPGFVAVPVAVTNRDPSVTLSTSPPSPYTLTSTVVGLWHFDEGGGTKAADSSVYSNHGTLTCLPAACVSTPTWTGGPAYHEGAASFSGQPDSLVLVPHHSAYNFTGDITVAAWVNPASASMPGAGGSIACKGLLNDEPFCLDVAAGRYRFRVDQSPGGAQFVTAVSTQGVRVGQWDRVVGTYEAAAGRARIYVNGVLSATTTGTPDTRETDSVPVSIGNRQSSSGNWDLGFQGLIDEVRIVNGLYSPAQVLEDYAGSFTALIALPPPNDGICLVVPPNAFSAPALFYATKDPMSHPLHTGFQALASGLASLPTGQLLLPGSLVEIVPTVGGLPFTSALGAPVTLCLPYADSNNDGIVDGTSPPISVSGLKIYTLDESVVRWVALPSSVDGATRRVYAETPHFSLFGLFGTSSIGGSIGEARVFPVPWKRGSGGRFDAPGLTFENLPQDGTLRILNLAGEKVHDIAFSGLDGGTVVWDGRNQAGRTVASGVYFALVKAHSGASTTLKFAIER